MGKTIAQIVGSIVDELSALSSEERKRAVQAAMTLLGEDTIKAVPQIEEVTVGTERLNMRVRAWMKQNEISMDELQQAFLIDNDNVEVIATVPGSNKKEQTQNAYILTGIGRFLLTGEQKFDDASARSLCQRFGFYDSANHAKHTKANSGFTGASQSGWTITQPGLKAGAALVKTIAK
jgi:hypothetical protein